MIHIAFPRSKMTHLFPHQAHQKTKKTREASKIRIARGHWLWNLSRAIGRVHRGGRVHNWVNPRLKIRIRDLQNLKRDPLWIQMCLNHQRLIKVGGVRRKIARTDLQDLQSKITLNFHLKWDFSRLIPSAICSLRKESLRNSKLNMRPSLLNRSPKNWRRS